MPPSYHSSFTTVACTYLLTMPHHSPRRPTTSLQIHSSNLTRSSPSHNQANFHNPPPKLFRLAKGIGTDWVHAFSLFSLLLQPSSLCRNVCLAVRNVRVVREITPKTSSKMSYNKTDKDLGEAPVRFFFLASLDSQTDAMTASTRRMEMLTIFYRRATRSASP